jgi:pimeloyl-ACP methyl ester carboxylesterase
MPYVQTNGIKLYYEAYGNGDPLLLIMGLTAAGSAWKKHAAYWSNTFRCITTDNRGVGLSDAPHSLYSTEQMADDYAGLLDSLGLENVRVVGCSMGSAIAQQLAIRHPKKVRSLVLMCPWARCDSMAKAIFNNIRNCKECLTPYAFLLYIHLLIYSKRYWDDPENVATLEKDREQAATEQNPQPLAGLIGQAAACITHNALADLKKVKQPALVIGGEKDIFTPQWMAEEVTSALPVSEIHLYEGCGHAFHWEAIDDFNPRVENWLLAH